MIKAQTLSEQVLYAFKIEETINGPMGFCFFANLWRQFGNISFGTTKIHSSPVGLLQLKNLVSLISILKATVPFPTIPSEWIAIYPQKGGFTNF